MAEKAILTKAAIRVAKAIHYYAARQKWSSADYHVFMNVRTSVYTLHIIVYAKAVRTLDSDQQQTIYDDISDEIDKRVPRKARPFNYVGLYLTDDKEFAIDRASTESDVEFEVDDRLLNEGVSWTEPYGQSAR